MYIVKLLTGLLKNKGSFSSKDENGTTYTATNQFYENNQNIFLDLMQNGKFAVVIDKEGSDRRRVTTFRTIQFISSSQEHCVDYRTLKIREEKILSNRMDLIEELLELLRSNSNPLRIVKIREDIKILEKELNIIKEGLEELNQRNF